MLHIIQGDLDDPHRSALLCDDAQARGLIGLGEAAQREFFSHLVHARTHGTHNPPGLLAANIKCKRSQVLTDRDDDGARSLYTLYRSRPDPAMRSRVHPARPASDPLPSAVRMVRAPLVEPTESEAAAARAGIEASLATARAGIPRVSSPGAVREPESKAAPAILCMHCGRDDSWLQSDGRCVWCEVLAKQARLEELQQLYPVVQAWDDATAEEGSFL
jgi:hypothetical protein